ncbi:gluconokinase [Pseudogemmobacter bohemicus]|uniref:gluconokinase n=1 Tax=Pseudogemmobacter bohemicus TaxID=2250708 RepID=UPI000DD31202|nr:gluconokinase [Pseudogemmobacter bohemicus]
MRNAQTRLVVMGVAGSGKSTLGQEIADRLDLVFIEGDDLHPAANIRKMATGIPLDDADRLPWLDAVGKALRAPGPGAVASCSALRRKYRDHLRQVAGPDLAFLYLSGAPELLTRRLEDRKGHFMGAAMLESQLATLEPPTGEPGVLEQNINLPVSAILERSLAWLKERAWRYGF